MVSSLGIIGGVIVNKNSPFFDELDPLSSDLFIFVKDLLDCLALFIFLSWVYGQRMVLIFSIGNINDCTRPSHLNFYRTIIGTFLCFFAVLLLIRPA